MIDYENGMTANDLPDFINHKSQPAEQRQVIRTKTLGDVMGEAQKPDYKKTAEKILREEAQTKKSEELAEQADEIKAKIIEKASEKHHIKYDVIEDADIVQISVVNSADGTIIRKVPPDKIVSFVKEVRGKKSKEKRNFDIKA